MDFGKELSCKYISCNFEWADSLEVNVVGQLAEGKNRFRFTRIQSVETTFRSGFCKVQTMPHHIPGRILQLIVKLSIEGRC